MNGLGALALLAALTGTALAGEPVVPGAGTLLQDLRPAIAPPAVADPGLVIEEHRAAEYPATAAFPITALRIDGNTAFDTATLHALVADAEGTELTLQALDARVARIGDFYHAHGYPLARAVIPAQTIRDGIVDIEIIEARYGNILLENRGRVNDALLRSTLAPLAGGALIEQSTLDHVLLLVGDIPGIAQSATLQPGAAPGTSDLLVQNSAGARTAGSVTFDNDGNRYTGGARGGGEFALYDPLRHGDVVDASLLTSGKGLEYGRLSYDVLLNGAGTHVGAAYSALHYILGDSLVALEGHGTADVDSAWVRQPLVRTRDVDVYGELQFDHKTLRDDIDVSDIRTHRHLNTGTLTLSGDVRDTLCSGGSTTWSLQWVRGAVGFDDAAAAQADAATARTAGAFSTWNVSFSRLQRLGAREAVSVSVSGQEANGNLDPSQKLVAGGRYSVRSYAMNALSGDTGAQASVEERHDLLGAWHGQWQALTFFDAEYVQVNKNRWTMDKNDATLRGTGVGLGWANPSRWSAKAYVALRLGSAPQLIGDSSQVRGWFEINKGF